MDGVILLTRESPGVRELAGRVVRGVRFCTLKEWRKTVDFDAATVLRPQQVARLGRLLEPRSAVALDGSLRRFAGYVNLERRTPPAQRFHRAYRGVHATRHDKVILHLYDLSASDEAHPETRAKREFETLHRLQLHAWAPRVLDSWQPAPGYAGEMHFFTVADPLAPSVEKRAADRSWDTPARLAFARAALGALGELHEETVDDAPILHRNLTPGDGSRPARQHADVHRLRAVEDPVRTQRGVGRTAVRGVTAVHGAGSARARTACGGRPLGPLLALRQPARPVRGPGRRNEPSGPWCAGFGNGGRSVAAQRGVGDRRALVGAAGRIPARASATAGAVLDGRPDRTLPWRPLPGGRTPWGRRKNNFLEAPVVSL